jgi:hypothetical protein
MVSEAAMLVEVDDQEAVEHIQYDAFCDIRMMTYAFSQYLDRRRASYRCLTICSPDAMGLVGCIESMVQHSGLMYEKVGRVPCSKSR